MYILGNLVKRKKIILTISIISGLVLLFSRCVYNSNNGNNDARGEGYAGTKTCIKCHGEIFNNYQHTAHFRTSRPIKDLPENWFPKEKFSFNDSVSVSVEKRDSGIFQVEYVHGKEALSKHYNMAIGSGDDAVSFGYWQDKKVFQLPLSYFSAIHDWANSPGFPSAEPYFTRPILSRCFECHSSFIAEAKEQTEGLTAIRNLDEQSVIYGIDCERCHGPGAKHVNFQTENPTVKAAKYMVSWESLSRQQKLDACAVCHSGNDLAMQQSTFWFRQGDTLANYYFPFGNSSKESDVHGKQAQLLAASRCFQMSTTLECSTCHSPHQFKPNDLVISSQPCINCHNGGDHKSCPVAASSRNVIANNCIDCHMPDMASKKISFQTSGTLGTHPYLLRTHRIGIYPEESQKILMKLKGMNKEK